MDMNAIIETPTVGEILFEEFMGPLGISTCRLSKEIGVPTSRIQDILHSRRKIIAETSLRLSKYFGVSEKYFLNIQNDIDIRNLKNRISESLNAINSVATA
ncbi:MAG: HigA family addiction module antidote protein [Clostridiales bacterium]|nr:HigA family addiction module antidote protein [Clostridiales bacterium]